MRWRVHTAVSSMFRIVLVILISTASLSLLGPAALAQPQDQSQVYGERSIRPLWEQQGVDTQVAKKLLEEGISAYQQQRYEEAASKLAQARALVPTHSPTLLYLGLAYLQQGKTGEAIATWQAYTKLQPYTETERTGGLATTIPQYLTVLQREENHQIAREAVTHERQMGPGDPRAVAITYYRNLGAPELAFLQKGLTALLISDLALVRDLRVVDRDRLQALLEELRLGTTGLVDQNTSPRVGRLLGAGKVVTGDYQEPVKDALRVNSVLVESTTGQTLGTPASSGIIQHLSDLEKALALALLKNLGYDEQRLQTAGVLDAIRRPHTISLPAFRAYANGLDAKDRGDYGTARTHFQQALRDDPNFALAQRELITLPAAPLTPAGIITSVQTSLPPASTAIAGLVAPVAPGATGGGLPLTTIGIGALVVGGAAIGIAVGVGGGGGGNNKCGNGRIDGKEQCDPKAVLPALCPEGLAGTPTFCTSDCSIVGCSICGNGVVEGNEECDDGNIDNDDACVRRATLFCEDAFCGDDFVCSDVSCLSAPDGVEACDDGNNFDGDGCSGNCEEEP